MNEEAISKEDNRSFKFRLLELRNKAIESKCKKCLYFVGCKTMKDNLNTLNLVSKIAECEKLKEV